MKNKLEEMYVEDQEIQKYDNNRLDDQAYLDSMNLELEKICKKNTLIVKEYFKNYSCFPNFGPLIIIWII